ncbi:enoyl-CoA hydratase-related protein [Kineosporia rhizophila]|uniref:enoyl-CoA hydratase/isomerase family protein n=1 Tax=Kineosporia rhizophila TaxID=84633 RepID=UPI001E3FECF6|nr:enoyl-CoA hydratase-related protein [Kineosporia rhizophila]MCE0535137.1 enoyl-CoA hydratase-related protein [Kineosporia rhizophila]
MMVLVEREGAVSVLCLNRPKRRNALDAESKKALRRAMEEAAADDQVRAVVLTGAGGAFCGGQDLAEHAEALRADPGHAFDTVEQDYAPVIQALLTMPKPVIAAVEGACAGAGLALALACDLRVFAQDAVLTTAFTAIGLTCDSGLSLTLPRSVGETRAKELLLLGDTFSPTDAVAWGIAGRIVPAGQALPQARELAGRLAAGPTLAYAETKRLISTAPLATVLHNEALAQARLGLTHDHTGAVEAFLDRRRFQFEGH